MAAAGAGEGVGVAEGSGIRPSWSRRVSDVGEAVGDGVGGTVAACDGDVVGVAVGGMATVCARDGEAVGAGEVVEVCRSEMIRAMLSRASHAPTPSAASMTRTHSHPRPPPERLGDCAGGLPAGRLGPCRSPPDVLGERAGGRSTGRFCPCRPPAEVLGACLRDDWALSPAAATYFLRTSSSCATTLSGRSRLLCRVRRFHSSHCRLQSGQVQLRGV